MFTKMGAILCFLQLRANSNKGSFFLSYYNGKRSVSSTLLAHILLLIEIY